MSFGKLGNWEVYTSTNFPISQIVLARWAGVFRKVGKLGSIYLYKFPNFPNSAGPDGLGSFGKLENWEYIPLPIFPISQMVLGHLGWYNLGNREIRKYVPVLISQFPDFPSSAEPDGLRSFGKFGNWEKDWARFVCKEGLFINTALGHQSVFQC